MAETILELRNANIYQGDSLILGNVNFSVRKGEMVYLVGKTGSGKSSLLKTLYGDLPLNIGAVLVAGFTIKGLAKSKIPLLRRKLGIIFQDFQLLNDRTVAENMMFVMRATGWTDNVKMRSRLSDVLMQVGL